MKFINWIRRRYFGETKEQQDIREIAKATGLSEEFVAGQFADAKTHGMKITFE